jgi:hypothetical protein
VQDVVALEVALLGHVPVAADEIQVARLDEPRHLVPAPNEVLPLLALAVGVRRRVERTLGMAEAGDHVVERLLDDAPPVAGSSYLIRLEIHARNLRVVVEHLLEVRHEPARVDGVAVEAAADVVVDAAGRHTAGGQRDGIEERRVLRDPVAPEEELEHGGVWELGCAPETTLIVIDVSEKRLGRSLWKGRIEGRSAAGHRFQASEPVEYLPGGLADVVGPLVIRAHHRVEHAGESGSPWRSTGGKYVPP